ncbi:outer membrane beta-barrel family protein [Niabella terrae]
MGPFKSLLVLILSLIVIESNAAIGYEVEKHMLPSIIDTVPSKSLDTVLIKTIPKLITYKSDGLFFNISQSPFSQGESIFDILKYIPNIETDQHERIRVMGKGGFILQVNNRNVNVYGEQQTNFLKTLNSENVEKIEIITSPSSKYDAQGASAVINIILKKVKPGTSVSIFLNSSQGKYNSTSAGGSFAMGGKKYSLGIDLSKGIDHPNERKIEQRRLSGNSFTEYNSFENSLSKDKNFNLRIFGDFNIGKTILISPSVNILNSNAKGSSISDMTITSDQVTNANSNTTTKNSNYLIIPQLYMSKILGKEKLDKIELNLNSISYEYKYNSKYEYISQGPTSISDSVFNVDIPKNNSRTKSREASLNYEKTFHEGLKLESGVKYFANSFSNKYEYVDPDNLIQSHYDYKENITALFFNLKKDTGVTTYQTGFRVEKSNINGVLNNNSEDINYNLFNFFPNFSFNHRFKNRTNVSLAFNTRIQRPSFKNLNPSRTIYNPYTSEVGNPDLKATLTYAFTARYAMKSGVNITCSYTILKNSISQVPVLIDSTNSILNKYININNRSVSYFGVYYPIRVSKSLFSIFNGSCILNTYSNNNDLYKLNKKAQTYRISNTTNYKASKTSSVRLSMIYFPRSQNDVATSKNKFILDIAFKKSFFNQALSVVAKVEDLFYTGREIGVYTIQGQTGSFEKSFDSRRISLSLSYSIQKGKINRSTSKNDNIENQGRIM